MSKFLRETNDIINFIGDGQKTWDAIFGLISYRLTRQQLNSVMRKRQFVIVDHEKKQRYDSGCQQVRVYAVRGI